MGKKICVVGVGYVGLLTAVGLADFGNSVVGVDTDKNKIESLKQKNPVIFEPGIEEYLGRNLESGRLSFSTDVAEAIRECEVIFIAVGTPSMDDGDADLSYVFSVVSTIKSNLNADKIVVIKSTVPIGTNRIVSKSLYSTTGYRCEVVSNPEFLREGKAVYDFFHPDRVVIGYESNLAKENMEDVYRALNRINVPFVWCNWETAELVKYASNCFLALKIGFINQIACLSEEAGADVQTVAKAMGMDGRIGSKFLHAGPGYGGSCFPKDTKALANIGQKYGSPITLIETLIVSNELQKIRIYQRLIKRVGELHGKTISVLGLAFKAETDDIRESSAITIISSLLHDGAIVRAHDPKAMERFSEFFPEVYYAKSVYEAAEGAAALLILTEWNEYRSLDLVRIKESMEVPYIFDTRNVVNEDDMRRCGFTFDFIGRATL